jgi:hypothetical protein
MRNPQTGFFNKPLSTILYYAPRFLWLQSITALNAIQAPRRHALAPALLYDVGRRSGQGAESVEQMMGQGVLIRQVMVISNNYRSI